MLKIEFSKTVLGILDHYNIHVDNKKWGHAIDFTKTQDKCLRIYEKDHSRQTTIYRGRVDSFDDIEEAVKKNLYKNVKTSKRKRAS